MMGIPMKHLKYLRQRQGVSQKDVASYLGITRQAYSNYENGNRQPDNEAVLKLAEYFDVSADTILRGQEKENPALGYEDGPTDEDLDLIRQFQALQETLSDHQKILLGRILETSLRRVQAATVSVQSEEG